MFSRDVRSVGKDIKYGFNVRIYDFVGWGVDIGVGVKFCIRVNVGLKMYKMESNLWVIL